MDFKQNVKGALLSGNLSQGFASRCGVPEGDPIRVIVGSRFLNWLLFTKSGAAVPFAYVDNWEIVSESRED